MKDWVLLVEEYGAIAVVCFILLGLWRAAKWLAAKLFDENIGYITKTVNSHIAMTESVSSSMHEVSESIKGIESTNRELVRQGQENIALHQDPLSDFATVILESSAEHQLQALIAAAESCPFDSDFRPMAEAALPHLKNAYKIIDKKVRPTI